MVVAGGLLVGNDDRAWPLVDSGAMVVIVGGGAEGVVAGVVVVVVVVVVDTRDSDGGAGSWLLGAMGGKGDSMVT